MQSRGATICTLKGLGSSEYSSIEQQNRSWRRQSETQSPRHLQFTRSFRIHHCGASACRYAHADSCRNHHAHGTFRWQHRCPTGCTRFFRLVALVSVGSSRRGRCVGRPGFRVDRSTGNLELPHRLKKRTTKRHPIPMPNPYTWLIWVSWRGSSLALWRRWLPTWFSTETELKWIATAIVAGSAGIAVFQFTANSIRRNIGPTRCSYNTTGCLQNGRQGG